MPNPPAFTIEVEIVGGPHDGDVHVILATERFITFYISRPPKSVFGPVMKYGKATTDVWVVPIKLLHGPKCKTHTYKAYWNEGHWWQS